jgi:hypothetical protein
MSAKFLFDCVVGFVAIASFILYLWELRKRKNQDERMLYFLHGAKSLVEVMSKRATSTGADWQPLLLQINDMLNRLQPPKRAKRVYKPEPSSE